MSTRLFDGRGQGEAEVEQATGGVDVQGDRLVYAVLGFAAGNEGVAVLDHGVVLGDPLEDDVWHALASTLGQPHGGLPVSAVSVDAGFSDGGRAAPVRDAPLVDPDGRARWRG